MNANFISKLRNIQRKNNSVLCVGLDTDVTKVPEFLYAYGDPQYEFNRRIIDATKDIVCAYKINTAFYEAAGEHGWYTIHQTLARIPDTIVTIGDGKRGDIENSSERYAHLFMEDYEFDGVTVNPFMGKDSVAPFLRSVQQCAFLLAVTSNSGAKDFQYLKVGKKYLYEKIVETGLAWNSKKNIGFVAGATRPKELRAIRKRGPDVPILIPGIGTQRGSLADAVRYGCDRNGELAIINASRSIIYASSGEDFAATARAKALKLRDAMNKYREQYFS